MDSTDEDTDDDSGNETSEFNNSVEFKPNNQKDKQEDYPFEVLTIEQILQHMNERIENVRTVVEMPATVTRMLLNHFRWNKEKLMEKFYEEESHEKLFHEAHIKSPFAGAVVPAPKPSPIKVCQICLSARPSSKMSGLECGHRFCNPCWNEYLTLKIFSEDIQAISCAAHNCDSLIDDTIVIKLITDSKGRTQYQHLITNGFVQCNRYLRWCPTPDCSSVIRVKQVKSRPVTCRCGHTFCFDCGYPWHAPIQCALLLSWMAKFDDDYEISSWIVSNTKECPKCMCMIENIEGSNHMICQNLDCKKEFWWDCSRPWEQHSFHEKTTNYCSRRRENASHCYSEDRAALKRFVFYCNRYSTHMHSFCLEHQLYATVKVKMEEMQQFNMSSVEVQFMKKAVDILCQSRRTLMYTYAFAYYLKKSNNQTVMLEDNQKDLESSTEKLSEYLERDITEENLVDLKQELRDQYRYCDLRRRSLTDHVYEGYQKGWWEYNK